MPGGERPLKVFLCHAHEDRDAVHALYARLTDDGVDVWLDKEKLMAGADWEREIARAVRKSDVFVVCHSKHFNQKGFRQKEVGIALEEAKLLPKGEIFIIPVRLEECDVLEDLTRWQWVDLFEKDGYGRLMHALHVQAEKVGAKIQEQKGPLEKVVDVTKIDASTNRSIPDISQGNNVASPLLKFNKKIIWAVGIILAAILSIFGLFSLLDSPITRSNPGETPVPNTAAPVSALETQEVSEMPPSATETNTPTATFTPSVTPTFTITPTPTPSGFEIVSISTVSYRGGTASAEIKTQPGTTCALGFTLPSGKLSEAGGTGPDTADEDGICSWAWNISFAMGTGRGWVYIEAGGENETYPLDIK